MGAANGVLKKGFALPTFEGVSLVNAELDLDGPYLRVATDLVYDPAPAATRLRMSKVTLLGYDDEVVLSAKRQRL